MKKYNCFEDLREQFSGDIVFEFGGEIFDLVDYGHYNNNTTIHGVNIIDTANGLIIRIYTTENILQYIYRAV